LTLLTLPTSSLRPVALAALLALPLAGGLIARASLRCLDCPCFDWLSLF
jgi:hypothetical protein